MENPSDFLFKFLSAAVWRFRLSRGIRNAGWGLLAGSGISTVLFFCFPNPLFVFLPIFFTLVFFAGGLFLPLSTLKVAQRIDRRLNLNDRMETAWEIRNHPERFHPGFAEAQHRDTAESLFGATASSDLSCLFPIAFSLRLLTVSLCFYGLFALLVVWKPATFPDSSLIEPVPTTKPMSRESAQTPDEVLQSASKTVEKAADEHPQVLPLQELNAHIRCFSPLSSERDEKETLALLRNWESELSTTIERLDDSSSDRTTFSGEGRSFTGEDQEREICLALLREELSNITLCRLDISDAVSRNGGEENRTPENGKNSWGKGGSESEGSAPTELLNFSELVQEGLVPGLPTGEGLKTDPVGERAEPETGRSERKFSSAPEIPPLISVPPVLKREIPPETRELVKKYFDY